MDYQRLQQLTNKVLLKVNTDKEYVEYLRLHSLLEIELEKSLHYQTPISSTI